MRWSASARGSSHDFQAVLPDKQGAGGSRAPRRAAQERGDRATQQRAQCPARNRKGGTMIDRKLFFDGVRARLFSGRLSQGQVDGMNAILAGFEKRYPNGDKRWLAYCLATAKWETAGTMQPVREAFWLSEEWRRQN